MVRHRLLFGVVYALLLLLTAPPALAQEAAPPKPKGESWTKKRDPDEGYISLGIWFLEFKTEIQDEDNGILGTKIDLEDDLDISEREYVPWFEAAIGGTFRFGLGYFSIERDGSVQTVSQSIRFRGQPVASPGDAVEVDEDLMLIDGWVELELISRRIIRVTPMVGFKYFHHFIKINNTTTTLQVDRTTDAVIPWIGASIEFTPFFEYVTINLQVRWVNLTSHNIKEIEQYQEISEEKWLEVRAGLGIWLIPDLLGLIVEYRYISFEITKIPDPAESTDFDFEGGGVAAYAVLRF